MIVNGIIPFRDLSRISIFYSNEQYTPKTKVPGGGGGGLSVGSEAAG